MRRRAGAGTSFVVALCLAQLCLAGDCVDGVTPDCSDAATQCGPNLDGSTLDGTVPNEASADAKSDVATTSDAAADVVDASLGDADASDQ
jgi:hypothetical protein